MENLKGTLWYLEFDWSMIWVCVGAVIVLLLYMEVYGSKQVTEGKTGEVLRNKWVKPIYHLLAGLLTLTFITELGYSAIKNYIGLSIDAEGNLLHFLAFLSGTSGGYIVARIIRFVQKLK